jgi:hypothetical protein
MFAVVMLVSASNMREVLQVAYQGGGQHLNFFVIYSSLRVRAIKPSHNFN